MKLKAGGTRARAIVSDFVEWEAKTSHISRVINGSKGDDLLKPVTHSSP